MSDPDALTPAQDAEVRRLLRSARVTEPMPPEMVDRLDATLRELTAERSDQEPAEPSATDEFPDAVAATPAAPVISLDARRMRRAKFGRGLLVAAAVVAVVGVGGPTVLRSVNVGGSASSDAGGGAAAGDSAPRTAQQESDSKAVRDNQAPTSAQSVTSLVRADYLAADVAAAIAESDRVAATSGGQPMGGSAGSSPAPACVLPSTVAGATVPIEYVDAQGVSAPGVLRIAGREAKKRVVEVWLCGAAEPVSVVRVPR